jgi:hypothetical protein
MKIRVQRNTRKRIARRRILVSQKMMKKRKRRNQAVKFVKMNRNMTN